LFSIAPEVYKEH